MKLNLIEGSIEILNRNFKKNFFHKKVNFICYHPVKISCEGFHKSVLCLLSVIYYVNFSTRHFWSLLSNLCKPDPLSWEKTDDSTVILGFVIKKGFYWITRSHRKLVDSKVWLKYCRFMSSSIDKKILCKIVREIVFLMENLFQLSDIILSAFVRACTEMGQLNSFSTNWSRWNCWWHATRTLPRQQTYTQCIKKRKNN